MVKASKVPCIYYILTRILICDNDVWIYYIIITEIMDQRIMNLLH